MRTIKMEPFRVTRMLPEKPSEAILHVLGDLEAVEKSKDYIVDMDDWHVPKDETDSGLCHVCMAGSYLAMSTTISPHEHTTPEQVNGVGDNYLERIKSFDYLRMYQIANFLRSWLEMYPDQLLKINNRVLFKIKDKTQYNYDPALFKQNMRTIAEILKDEGY